MHVKVKTKEFRKALEILRKIVPIKGTMPVLTNFTIRKNGKKVSLTATNLESTVVVDLNECKDIGGGLKGLLPFTKTRLIFRLRNQEYTSITFRSDSVLIEDSEFSNEILVGEMSQFPTIPKPPVDHKITFSSENFKNLINDIYLGVSEETNRPIFTQIHLSVSSKQVVGAATDGKSIYESIVPCVAERPMELFLNPVIRGVLKGSLGKGEAVIHSVCQPGGYVSMSHIKCGNVSFFGHGIDDRFPDYEKAIPGSFNQVIKFDVKQLIRALSISALTVSDETYRCLLNFTGSILTVSGSESEVGSSTARIILLEPALEPLTIAFNVRYLKRMLKSLRAKEAKMHLSEHNAPIVITEAKRRNLLMPLRMN